MTSRIWLFKTNSVKGWDHWREVEDGEQWDTGFSSLWDSRIMGAKGWQGDLQPGDLGLWMDTVNSTVFAVCSLDGTFHHDTGADQDVVGGHTVFRLFTARVRRKGQTWASIGLPALAAPHFTAFLLQGPQARTLLRRLPSV